MGSEVGAGFPGWLRARASAWLVPPPPTRHLAPVAHGKQNLSRAT